MKKRSTIFYFNRLSNGAIAIAFVGMLLTAWTLQITNKKLPPIQADVTPIIRINTSPEVAKPGETITLQLDSNVSYDSLKWTSPDLPNFESPDPTVEFTIPNPTNLSQILVVASVTVGLQTKQIHQVISIHNE